MSVAFIRVVARTQMLIPGQWCVSRGSHNSSQSWRPGSGSTPRPRQTPDRFSSLYSSLEGGTKTVALEDRARLTWENGRGMSQQVKRKHQETQDIWNTAGEPLSSERVGVNAPFQMTLPKVEVQSLENFSVPKVDESNTSCEDYLTRVLLSAPRELTANEWRLIEEEVVGTLVPYEVHVDHNNRKCLQPELFASFVLSICCKVDAFDSALSFVECQEEPLSQIAIISLFNLFSRCPIPSLQLGQPRGDRFDRIVNGMIKENYDSFYDETKNAILAGRSRTPEWKTALGSVSMTSTIIGQTYTLKCFAISAIERKDFDVFWDVLNRPGFTHSLLGSRQSGITTSQNLIDTVFITFFKYCHSEVRKMRLREAWNLCEKMFNYFRDHGYHLRPEVLQVIVSTLKAIRRDKKGTPLFSSISQTGSCNSCGSEIEKPLITSEELLKLKDAIVSNIILKDDIYKATSPEDFENFTNHFVQNSNYDVVIDGLNVSLARFPGINHKSLRFQSETLYQTLKMTKKLNLKVFVIHRPVLYRYKDLSSIQELCDFIVLDRLTEDDPFAILATLMCGIGTKLITNDTLRQHFNLLTDFSTKKTFLRWQLSHQIYHYMQLQQKKNLDQAILPILTYPRIYSSDACRSGQFWHLPVDLRPTLTKEDKTMKNITFPKRWLCIPVPDLDNGFSYNFNLDE